MSTPDPFAAKPPHVSPVLASLDPTLRPGAPIACQSCPWAVWWTEPTGISCFCRTMRFMTHTPSGAMEILTCDGPGLQD